jgi:hypothetical protein
VILNSISRDITLKRRSVQSHVEISLFPLDKSGSSSAVNNTFLSFHIRDKKPQEMRCAMKKATASSILIAGILLAVAVLAEAQQAKKVYRIGYITNRTEIGPNEEAFQRGLRELGYY